MTPWGDREISRFTYRRGLFQRRGKTLDEAEQLADRLALRDFDRDDRRMCLECESLQADHPKWGRGCFAARQGLFGPGVPKSLSPIVDILQRCHQFSFQKP